MAKRKLIDIFKKEIYSTPAKKNYEINKTVVKHIENIWNLDLLDKID